MEKFEGLFEDLDVHTQVLDSTMSAATTLNTPEDQVESLMKQVAEQNGLEVLDKLAEHPVSQQTPASGVPTLSSGEEDKLSQRYKFLFIKYNNLPKVVNPKTRIVWLCSGTPNCGLPEIRIPQ